MALDAGRKHDVAELESAKKKAHDPESRKGIEIALDKIHSEQYDPWVRSARQRMIDEKLQGRNGNVADIQRSIARRNDVGRVASISGFGEGKGVTCDDCGVSALTTKIKSMFVNGKIGTKCSDCWDKPVS